MKRAPRDTRYYLKCLFPWTEQISFIHYYESRILESEECIRRARISSIMFQSDDPRQLRQIEDDLQFASQNLETYMRKLQEIVDYAPWRLVP